MSVVQRIKDRESQFRLSVPKIITDTKIHKGIFTDLGIGRSHTKGCQGQKSARKRIRHRTIIVNGQLHRERVVPFSPQSPVDLSAWANSSVLSGDGLVNVLIRVIGEASKPRGCQKFNAKFSAINVRFFSIYEGDGGSEICWGDEVGYVIIKDVTANSQAMAKKPTLVARRKGNDLLWTKVRRSNDCHGRGRWTWRGKEGQHSPTKVGFNQGRWPIGDGNACTECLIFDGLKQDCQSWTNGRLNERVKFKPKTGHDSN